MNEKLTNFFKTTRRFLDKHSPEILTGLGVAGMFTSGILAVKATPKALMLIEDKQKELYPLNDDVKLTVLETVQAAWKPYVPALALSIASTTCIIGASAVNYKRNAALATAYAISERTLIRYRDKVIDAIGDRKEREIRDKVAQDEVNNRPISNSQVIITSKGNTLCMDSISGRHFRSDLDTIRKTVNELNRQLLHQDYISLNEFYAELGLDPIKTGYDVGWNVSTGLIELEFRTCLADNDEPCIVVDYSISPRYEYDKLM